MRLIDGDELLTAFPVDDEPTLTKSCVRTTIKHMPTIEPEQRWIPCSERLPEVEELVLVTDDSGGIKTVNVDRCGQYENSDERFWYYTQNAVAWMPRPEPYKEGTE
jgi:hypothetical protein